MTSPIDLFAAFATDTPKEQEGVETQLPGCGDTKFRIARENNKVYSKLLQKLVKQNRAILDSKGDAAEAKSDQIMIEVMASTILLGWEGEISYKGEKHKYSKEMAKTLLAHKEFALAVMRVAGAMETFKLVKDEDEEKN